MHPGATLEKVRDRIVDAPRSARWDTRRAWTRTAARLPAPRLHLAGRADRRRARRLPGRRHGAGQDDHPDRAAPAPSRARLAAGPTLVVCPASLMGNWEAEVHRFAPGVAVRRFHGAGPATSRGGSSDGFVLTTYGTMRLDHETLRPGRLGPGRRRRGAAHQERHLLDRPQPAPDRLAVPGRADRHAGGEQPHRAVGDPRLGDARACSAPATPSARSGPRRSRAASTRPSRAASPSWSSRSCCAAASPTPASRPSCRRRPRPTRSSA